LKKDGGVLLRKRNRMEMELRKRGSLFFSRGFLLSKAEEKVMFLKNIRV
jgi:hypothetical protein